MNFFFCLTTFCESVAAQLITQLGHLTARVGVLGAFLLLMTLSWAETAIAIAPSPSLPSSTVTATPTALAVPAIRSAMIGSDLESAGLISYLPPGNAIKDGKALLRYALPIDNKPIREVQKQIEEISDLLRVSGSRPMGSISRNIKRAVLELRRPQKILSSVPAERQIAAQGLLDQLDTELADLSTYTDAADRDAIYVKRDEILATIGELETLMVAQFPFEIPPEYDHLPRLLGRATVEMDTDYGTLIIVVDGYSAPLTAGNFVDLAQRGFYDGLEFTRVEDFYVVQAGDPPGPADGFIDPRTNEVRTIPLEILVKGDKEPLYGYTMEQMGITLRDPVLPFSAFGTMAMARPDRNVNGGSSQFFFLKFQSELTPAGINLLDGEYAVFGYVVENKTILDKLQLGDRINGVRVVEGAENLVQPI